MGQMGYVLPEVRDDFVFEDVPGLEVNLRLSPVPLGDYLAFLALPKGTEIGVQYARFMELAKPTWNLPEEPTVEGFMQQPFEIMRALISTWIDAIPEVPIPLGRRSNGTGSLETRPPRRRRNSSTRSS